MNRRDLLQGSLAAMLVPPSAPAALTILVPAYFYPEGKGLKEWDRLIASARKVPIVVIANPASGPGEKPDPLYTAVFDRAAKAGIVLIGYVSTRYAKRPADQIVEDMGRWTRFYPQIRGFFLDEQASAAAQVPFYVDLAANARRILPAARIVANPGTTCDEAYIEKKTADIACLFEGAPAGFFDWKRPRWAENVPASRFAAIVYDVRRQDAMPRVIRESRAKGFGVVYVTDARGDNPYDRLPTYWEDEVQFVVKGENER